MLKHLSFKRNLKGRLKNIVCCSGLPTGSFRLLYMLSTCLVPQSAGDKCRGVLQCSRNDHFAFYAPNFLMLGETFTDLEDPALSLLSEDVSRFDTFFSRTSISLCPLHWVWSCDCHLRRLQELRKMVGTARTW